MGQSVAAYRYRRVDQTELEPAELPLTELNHTPVTVESTAPRCQNQDVAHVQDINNVHEYVSADIFRYIIEPMVDTDAYVTAPTYQPKRSRCNTATLLLLVFIYLILFVRLLLVGHPMPYQPRGDRDIYSLDEVVPELLQWPWVRVTRLVSPMHDWPHLANYLAHLALAGVGAVSLSIPTIVGLHDWLFAVDIAEWVKVARRTNSCGDLILKTTKYHIDDACRRHERRMEESHCNVLFWSCILAMFYTSAGIFAGFGPYQWTSAFHLPSLNYTEMSPVPYLACPTMQPFQVNGSISLTILDEIDWSVSACDPQTLWSDLHYHNTIYSQIWPCMSGISPDQCTVMWFNNVFFDLNIFGLLWWMIFS